MPPNERLRTAIAAAGETTRTLAETVGTDPKTIERWVNTGRTPHRRNAHRVAEALKEDVAYLWPWLDAPRKSETTSHAELIRIYPQRSDVPLEAWRAMFERAQTTIEVMVYAAVFLHEQMPDLNDLLRAKAAAGCRVRLLIGDPDSQAVRLRGEEEKFGHGIESRCRLARLHYAPVLGVEGIDVAQHATTLYNSVYRADGELFANTHVYGANAYANPVFHLRRREEQGMFDAYAASFEAVWSTAEPIRE
jgi:transcriptional regulator with XRE-family HTH domain